MFRAFTSGVAAAALLFAAGSALAQDFSGERISNDIRAISTDEFQGRYPGTEGERMTLAWLQAQYEAMGLEPGGPNGQWLQPVHLSAMKSGTSKRMPVMSRTDEDTAGIVATALNGSAITSCPTAQMAHTCS